MKRSDIEIMAPVGSYESLHAAIAAGANSIYFGVEQLNMRAKSAANFTLDDLSQIVAICKENSIKSYLTVNIAIYSGETQIMEQIIDRAKAEGIDAIIAADFAAILYAHSVGVEVHISTQCNIANTQAVKLYSQWADVVVLARELSLPQIEAISCDIEQQNICGPSGRKVEIEMFAHGALCMSISGKCYLSLHESDHSANRGACRQICRRKYTIQDTQTGEMLDTDGQYILSPKDLCTIEFLDKFIAAGVKVLKIEGRARGGEYVKRVVEAYDSALRLIESGEYNQQRVAPLVEQLETVFNRGFWGGYYSGATIAQQTSRHGSSATQRKVYVGKVTNFFKKLSVAEILVEASTLTRGDNALFMGSTTGVYEQQIGDIILDNKVIESVAQGTTCSVKTKQLVRRGDKLYKMVDASLVDDQQ